MLSLFHMYIICAVNLRHCCHLFSSQQFANELQCSHIVSRLCRKCTLHSYFESSHYAWGLALWKRSNDSPSFHCFVQKYSSPFFIPPENGLYMTNVWYTGGKPLVLLTYMCMHVCMWVHWSPENCWEKKWFHMHTCVFSVYIMLPPHVRS